MIQAEHVTKRFDDTVAVNQVTAKIKEGSVYGLVGTNGAGKSTFLRMVCGIIRPDEGEILIDNEEVYETPKAKSRLFYVSDDQFFFRNTTALDMMRFYKTMYPEFDVKEFEDLMKTFELPEKKKISTFSKGMKKQLSILFGICSKTKYLLLDETFDGLDPVMRQAVKSLFAKEMVERGMTPVIASHNLRELEDICEHVGLLHRGGILFSRELDEMKVNIHKIQCVLRNPGEDLKKLGGLTILKKEQRGSLFTLTVRGEKQEAEAQIQKLDPLFFETLPLTLEEIFISETEVAGYDIKNLIL